VTQTSATFLPGAFTRITKLMLLLPSHQRREVSRSITEWRVPPLNKGQTCAAVAHLANASGTLQLHIPAHLHPQQQVLLLLLLLLLPHQHHC
jgi:hypothetical protein